MAKVETIALLYCMDFILIFLMLLMLYNVIISFSLETFSFDNMSDVVIVY